MKFAHLYLFLVIFFFACEGPEGPVGPSGPAGSDGAGAKGNNSLVALTDEPAGANCASGGVKITVGVDTNGNNTLDVTEVSTTRFVCNGSASSGGPKELRLSNFNIFTPGADYEVSAYIDFDISNYPGYDAIGYVLYDVEVTQGGNPVDVDYTVEAFDSSNDDEPIEGSQVIVNNDNPRYVSPNFITHLPTGKFNLGLRMFRTPGGTAQLGGNAYLVLYKTK